MLLELIQLPIPAGPVFGFVLLAFLMGAVIGKALTDSKWSEIVTELESKTTNDKNVTVIFERHEINKTLDEEPE